MNLEKNPRVQTCREARARLSKRPWRVDHLDALSARWLSSADLQVCSSSFQQWLSAACCSRWDAHRPAGMMSCSLCIVALPAVC